MLLGLAVGLGHWTWIQADQGPFPGPDDYNYLSRSLRLSDALTGISQAPVPSLSEISPGGRPPLYQLLSLPAFVVFERSADAATAINGAFLALLMLATYGMASIRGGPLAGVVASFVVVCLPPIIHLTRGYRPHAALPACVALSLWLLMRLLERPGPPRIFAFAASLIFGTLIHPAFVFVLTVPTLFGAVASLWTPRRAAETAPPATVTKRALLLRGWVPAGLLVVVIVAGWYVGFGLDLWRAWMDASSSDVHAFRGSAIRVPNGIDRSANVAWYLTTAPLALSWVIAGLTVPALLTHLTKHRRAIDWVLAITVVSTLVVLSALSTFSWMYAAAALPALAALVAVFVARLGPLAVRGVVIALLMLTSALTFAWVSWGHPGLATRPIASILGAQVLTGARCQLSRVLCAAPPRRAPLRAEHLLGKVLEDPRCSLESDERCRLMVVGTQALNARMLEFHLERGWPGSDLWVSGPRTGVFGGAYPLRMLFRSDYIAFERHERTFDLDTSRGNYLAATLALLHDPPRPMAARLQSVGTFRVAGRDVELMRRVSPYPGPARREIARVLGLDMRGRPLNRPNARLRTGQRATPPTSVPPSP